MYTMLIVNMRFGDNVHIHNKQGCTFTMCIVACVQCDSDFRMGNAWYEGAIYRYNAYCEYATLLVVNVQIITEMHVHNLHSIHSPYTRTYLPI